MNYLIYTVVVLLTLPALSAAVTMRVDFTLRGLIVILKMPLELAIPFPIITLPFLMTTVEPISALPDMVF